VDLGTVGRNMNGKRGTGGRRRARSGAAGKQQTDGQPQPESDVMVSTESAQAAEEGSEVDSGIR
jgi:hypothetical protein